MLKRRALLGLILTAATIGAVSSPIFGTSTVHAQSAGRGGGGGGGGGGGEGSETNLQAFFREEALKPPTAPPRRTPRRTATFNPDGCGGDPSGNTALRRFCDARRH